MSIIDSIKFIKNISDYYLKNRNHYFVANHQLPDNTVVYKKGKYFLSPDNLVIYKLWENHCTANYTRHEISDFLNLIKEKKSLLDIGASSGMFSAIFSVEKSSYSIISVEPDDVSYDHLLTTIELNKKKESLWIPVKSVMSDFDGKVNFNDGPFGGTVGENGNEKLCYKMQTLCDINNFKPDVIKLDIESYEYEVVMSSANFLNNLDVNIQIEIHNELIIGRGLNPWKIYDLLLELGFRGVGAEGNLNKKQLKKELVHLHLIK